MVRTHTTTTLDRGPKTEPRDDFIICGWLNIVDSIDMCPHLRDRIVAFSKLYYCSQEIDLSATIRGELGNSLGFTRLFSFST